MAAKGSFGYNTRRAYRPATHPTYKAIGWQCGRCGKYMAGGGSHAKHYATKACKEHDKKMKH